MDILQQLQDTMTVLAGIQERQARVRRLQAEELDAIRERNAEIAKRVDLLERELETDRATRAERMAEWDARIEKLVSGFGAAISQWDSLQKRVEALERRIQ